MVKLRDQMDWYLNHCSSLELSIEASENGGCIHFVDGNPLSGTLFIDEESAEYVGDD